MSMSEDDEFSHQSQLALEISRHEIRKLRAKLQAAEAEVARLKGSGYTGRFGDLIDIQDRRIAELEAAICDWYEWAGNDDPSDRPLDRLNDIAKALLDGRGE